MTLPAPPSVPAPEPMAAFRALVMADPALQAQLGVLHIPDDYAAAASAIAAAHGIALPPEAFGAGPRLDPLGIDRLLTQPVTADGWLPRGWLPARAVPAEGGPAFDWAWFGDVSLDAPFYEDSVRQFANRPFNRAFRTRTGLDAVIAGSRPGASEGQGPEPAGFVHHMSRCGSTLAAQMLAADPAHVVLSEPEPLDAVLRWAATSDAPLADRITAVRAIVAALSRDRSGATRRVFFKLDSWHIAMLPLLRAAFPQTPWAFVYRNPVEVLVSLARERSLHTVPGMLPPGIVDIEGPMRLPPDRYAALVLAQLAEAAIRAWPAGGGLLVDYAEMPDAILDRIAPHFGLVPDADQRAAMAMAATRSAKAPGDRFVPDAAAKRNAATPAIVEAARSCVEPVYRRLTALRDEHIASS